MTNVKRARCPICKRRIATYVPAGGDGSAVRLRPHVRNATPDEDPARFGLRIICEGVQELLGPEDLDDD